MSELVYSFQVLPAVNKIAVLRANAIGDFFFSLPALEALRATYPRSEIILLGQPWHADFLADRPGPIDRVVVVPPLVGIRAEEDGSSCEWNSTDARQFFNCMESEHLDLAIQLHGGGHHSNAFIARLGARVTVGLRTPDAAPLDLWLPFYYYQSEVLRALEVVSLVGAKPVILEPHLALRPEDLAESVRVVPLSSQPLVLLHPGAGDGRRRWPPEKFAQVGDALARAGARVVVSGSGWERELVDAVLAGMTSPAEDVCDRFELGGLAGLLSRCAVVVSNDSGPIHIAQAVGTATVGIYWCGNLITAGPMTRSRHRPVVSWRLLCPVCGNNCTERECEHHVSFVADVPVDAVTTHALDLLKRNGRPAPLKSIGD